MKDGSNARRASHPGARRGAFRRNFSRRENDNPSVSPPRCTQEPPKPVSAAPQFLAIMEAARRAGVHLGVSSAFRTHAEQVRLYALYRSGRGNKAARPGYSNHQMGLSVDLGNTGGDGRRNVRWLKQNAARFGFYNDVRGEPWHWTYKR